jgi:hexosaminidase
MRTAAIAERLWSPREINDIDDMYRRLDVLDMQLEELGLTHRKNQAMLLRRLANNHDISSLQTLVSVIEPVKIYQRYQQRPQSMLSPLTGLIDAAQADAPKARAFNKLVQKLIANKTYSADVSKLRSFFSDWQRSGMELSRTFEVNPSLFEAKQLATDLWELGNIGMEIAEMIDNGKSPDTGWRDAKLKRLAEIAKPKAALEIQVVESMKKLVTDVGSR